MRQFRIAERLAAAVLLPLAAMLSVPFLTAALMPYLDETNATYAEVFIALVIASIAGAVVLVMASTTRVTGSNAFRTASSAPTSISPLSGRGGSAGRHFYFCFISPGLGRAAKPATLIRCRYEASMVKLVA